MTDSPAPARPSLSSTVRSVLDALGPIPNRDIVADILSSAVRLAGDEASRLDLKITAAALAPARFVQWQTADRAGACG